MIKDVHVNQLPNLLIDDCQGIGSFKHTTTSTSLSSRVSLASYREAFSFTPKDFVNLFHVFEFTLWSCVLNLNQDPSSY